MSDFPQWHRVTHDRNGDPVAVDKGGYPSFGRRVLVSLLNPWTLQPQVYTARVESSEESLTGFKWLSAYTGGSVPGVYAWAEYPPPCPQEVTNE